MSRRIVQTSERSYLFSPDTPVREGARFWAVAKLSVRDELTGQPPTGIITVEVKERGLIPRIAGDGMVAVTGIPERAFPNLAGQDYPIHLTVGAQRYVTREVEIPVLKIQNATFPQTFTPPALVNLLLHREPVVITGRVVRANGGATVPLAGATITFTGIWRTPPPANLAIPADPPNLVSLAPPLSAERTTAAGHLRGRNLPPVVGDDKLLLDDVLAGGNSIRLTNRLNLSIGDILLIDANQPDIAEFIVITAITGASTPDQPASLTLAYPLARAHPRNALVQEVNPQPVMATKNFSTDALVGDTCVFLDNIAGLAAANEAEIFGGHPDEYHSLKRFSVTSDADGYYRLPPLSRVAQLEIHAEKIIGPDTFKTTTTFRPDYQQWENRLDLMLAV